MFTRKRRRLVSSLLVLGLLFSQFAVAAYACTRFQAAAADVAPASPAFVPCEEMDMAEVVATDEPARCLEHCKYGQQNLSSAAPVDIPPGTTVMLFELPPSESEEPTLVFVQPALLARSTSPPAYARSQRLRI